MEQLAVGNTMTVTLACDHRTVDGATGAKYLQTVRTVHREPSNYVCVVYLKFLNL